MALSDDQLLEHADGELKKAYTPYSNYRVGAVIETTKGTLYTGCNIENANYSNSIHAEELAMVKAIQEGEESFRALAVVSDRNDGVTPCGMCRQTLAEFADESLRIVTVSDRTIERYTLGELLPASFGGRFLDD